MAEPRVPEIGEDGFFVDIMMRDTIIKKIEKYDSLAISTEEKIDALKVRIIEADGMGLDGVFVNSYRVEVLKMYEEELKSWQISTEKWKNHIAIKS